jgi:hypothetical protein
MRNHAEAAGFRYVTTKFSGTTSAYELFRFGEPENEIDNGYEVPWFERWCAFGFRGMTAWLKNQL